MVNAETLSLERANFRADATTISVVALAHGTSHFFQLLLPPLFPWLAKEFSLSFTQLGALATLFYVVSAAGQAAAGFVVDKIGTRAVLFGGLALFALSALIAANANGYAMLTAAAMLSGLGNSFFHPVDYSIINQRVSSSRIGHAYSAHGLSGTFGYATSAFAMVLLANEFGWRNALYVAMVFAIVALVIAIVFRDAIDTRHLIRERAEIAKASNANEHALAFMKHPAVWLCFAFFFVLTFNGSALQNFSAPALSAIANIDLTLAATALTGYYVFNAIGQLGGGYIVAKKWMGPEQVIAAALAFSAAMLMLAAFGLLSGTAALLPIMLSGIGTGVAGPSRDLLIKQATPAGSTGRVYGMVYSGLDTGLAVSAPMFGYLMDHAMPRAIFAGAAIALVVALLLGLWVSRTTQHQLAAAK
ncbi:MAG: MFS transporter [Betaproteobacteria bacterium]|nr:MAG: MFS transporter [Betaproteobacteria bacterium]